MKTSLCALVGFLLPLAAPAQVAAPNSMGVSMGHLHIYSKDPAAQKKFWGDTLGATPAKLKALDVYKAPGVIIFVSSRESGGPSEGSTINHLGFLVRDLKAAMVKVDAAGIQAVSRNEKQATLLGPDGVRVELTEDTTIGEPLRHHHVHFYTTDVEATRQWYARMFGAAPGKRGRFEAADLPGANLSFSKAETAPAGTRGRSLDHAGFEVKDLEAFTKKLEAGGVKFDVPYRKRPDLGLSIAFLTDPWGTYIELTEGLTGVQ